MTACSNVVMLEYAELWKLAALAARVAAGEISGSDSVRLFAASRVRITSEPAMPFSLDGELLDAPPHAVELQPRALRLAAPPSSSMGLVE